MGKSKLLFITHEMSPFLELTKIAEITRQLPQAMQEKGLYNKGVALVNQQKLKESIDAWKNALKLDNTDADARENLQKALMQLKQQQQQQAQQQKSANFKWAQSAAPVAKAPIKSFTEIQAEEQAKLQKVGYAEKAHSNPLY